ncbi:MAG: hypothetical protein O3B04_07520 [Chloroflexi bacterium]|nr:hypothetical protein [Chloroflexota bacterium]
MAHMNVKLLLPALLIGIISVACAEGVGAVDPSLGDQAGTSAPVRNIATSEPATVTRLTSSEPAATSVVLATPVTVRPTSAPLPAATQVSRANAPSPAPSATPVRFDLNATPTPLWTPVPPATAVPAVIPSPTPFVQPTVVAAPEDLFDPLLNYRYTVPADWSERKTQSALVLADPSGKISVSITESTFERWRFQTIIALGATTFPDRPPGWSIWSSHSLGVIKANTAYEFQFKGVKNGIPYLQFIHWYVWGDVHVQVAADVPEFDWNAGTSVRSTLQSVLDNFAPHDETHLLTGQDVLAAMFDRLDNRPSGIYARNEALRMRFELTCRDIYTDLMSAPEYLGGGLWQLTAQTLEGTEAWWVFEPNGSIMSLNSNFSKC